MITERYDISTVAAIIHMTISTISFVAYASAKKGLLLIVKNAATKLVVMDTVLIKRLLVPKYFKIK